MCCRNSLQERDAPTAINTNNAPVKKRQRLPEVNTAAPDELSSSSDSESSASTNASSPAEVNRQPTFDSNFEPHMTSSLKRTAPAVALNTPAVPVTSAVFPSFTSRPAIQKNGLLRPEPRRSSAQQSVRRRPSSLDNNSTGVDSSPVTSSPGLLSRDHDSRLSAWQRVEASMRPAHSEPMISPHHKESMSTRRPAAVATSRSAATQPPRSPAIAAKPRTEQRHSSAPVNQRLQQVVRNPSANPSPPIAVVQPSTSNVAIVKPESVDRRQHRPDQLGTVRTSSADAKSRRESTRTSQRLADRVRSKTVATARTDQKLGQFTGSHDCYTISKI